MAYISLDTDQDRLSSKDKVTASTPSVEAELLEREAVRETREKLFHAFLERFYGVLTQEEFAVYFMRKFCEMSYEDIAGRTNKQQVALRVCFHRVKRKVANINQKN